ncbi:MAG: ubiquinol-cytochrome c reductase iron-sulfur subunit [Gammaproteobacteria bacterium]
MQNELEGPRFEKPVERRNFLQLASIGAFCTTILTALVGMFKLPLPVVFPEADSRFPIGTPGDFPAGQPVHLPSKRLWVFSDENGIAAVSTVCPHLGCLVIREEDGKFACPCHGSKFDPIGNVLSGPPPRGLIWVAVSLGPDGRLIVDSKREVSLETRFKI